MTYLNKYQGHDVHVLIFNGYIDLFLCGESQGRQGLVACRLWGRTELDTTEAT